MVFGCYALAKIGMGLISFKDCSEDAALLDEVSACRVLMEVQSWCFDCEASIPQVWQRPTMHQQDATLQSVEQSIAVS